MMFHSKFATLNDIRIHYVTIGDPNAPMILCLHGFPEFSHGWRDVMQELAQDYFLVAPDQRGYNLSDKPIEQEAYHIQPLASDMMQLADLLSPDKPYYLAGHDWGAAVAYAMSFKNECRIKKLIIANGVHPICFQLAILEDEDQRKASQYINYLRAEGSEAPMSADNFDKLIGMITSFSATPWFEGETRQRYIEAWSQKGALKAMINWYRASNIIVPKIGEAVDVPEFLTTNLDSFRVKMPHLLLWGKEDVALCQGSYTRLEKFCDDYHMEMIDNAGHWILHEQPAKVARAIREFIGN